MAILKPFFWGLGTAALAYFVSPRVKRMVKPMMAKGINGAMGLAEKGKETMESMMQHKRMDYETIEEQPEATRDTTLEQIQVERDRALDEIRELRSAISQLQSEIDELKSKF